MRRINVITLGACLSIGVFSIGGRCLAFTGEGHKLHSRDVYERLPEWEKGYLPKEIWERYYTDFCEYPDSRGPEKKHFKKEEYELFERLNTEFKKIGEMPGIPLDWHAKKDWPYLHGDYCLKAEFEFLVRALREKRFWDAGMWLGSIVHFISDRCDPGHCPMNFAWSDPYRKGWLDMTTSKGDFISDIIEPLDSFVIQYETDKDYYEKLMEGYTPELLAPTIEEAALLSAYKCQEVYLHALSLEEKCFREALERKTANKEVLEIAAHGTKATLDIFHTAFMIASGKAEGKYEGPEVSELLKESRKPLDSYFCYQGVIPKDVKPPMIGVLAYNPPCIYYDWGLTPFYAKIVLGELRSLGFNYGVITVDDLINPQVFNSRNYPVVLYPPTKTAYWRSYKSPNDCINAIDGYLKEGGSLLCIGGKPFSHPLDCLSGFWVSGKEADNPMAPFTAFFKDYNPPSKGFVLTRSKEAESILKDVPEQFEAIKDTNCLWEYSKFPGAFHEKSEYLSASSGKFTPLLSGGTKDKIDEVTAAGMLRYTGNGYKGRIVFLPLYLIIPYFFTDQKVIPDEEFFSPRMDPIPGKVFKNLIEYLNKPE